MKCGSKSDKVAVSTEDLPPTHKGWLGCCPVLIGAINTDAPTIAERHWSGIPLLHVVIWFYMALFALIGFMFPGAPMNWPLRITGKVEA